MKIDRKIHAAFLEDELNAQTEEFKQKLRTSAIQLMNNNELFVGLYMKFHSDGELLVMMSAQKGLPRKNEYYYCFLLPNHLRKYKEWGNRSYQDLISNELCATDLKCIWHNKSDKPGFILVGFTNASIKFKETLEANAHNVVLTMGPKVPPYEYLSNLHRLVLKNSTRFDAILDSDFRTNTLHPILVDGNTNIIEIANKEFKSSDIFTLQGPPGTGKTFRIAQLCEYLCSQGKSVLVTALTNVALISVAEKLEKKNRDKSINIYKTSLSADEKNKCPHVINTDDVVSIKGALVLSSFYKMSFAALTVDSLPLFDYVIVDEASQAFIATLAAAKRLGNKSMWVGDINQMPPISLLSENRIIKNGYAPLIDGLQTFVQSFDYKLYQLTTTYRLGERGAKFTGMFYNNTLKSVTTSQLFNQIPTDGPIIIKMPLSIGDTSPQNAIEKTVEIVKELNKGERKEIAILSHRIDTIISIQKYITKVGVQNKKLLIDTVARVQGMTKDYVIYVIPNTDCMVYCLEKRLFNVATSRAVNNTYIIIDNNYDSYKFADEIVMNYLKTADI